MEAVRLRRDDFQRDEQVEEEVLLDAPPAPFPTELLSEGSVLSDENNVACSPTSLASLNPNLSQIQQSCVQALSLLVPELSDPAYHTIPDLSVTDSRLAGALSDLLDVSYELEELCPSQSSIPSSTTTATINTIQDVVKWAEDLQKDVHARREAGAARTQASEGSQIGPAIGAVREELAWARVDVLTSLILGSIAIRERNASSSQTEPSTEDHPPEYESHDRMSLPPSYQAGTSSLHRSSSITKYGEEKEQDHQEGKDMHRGEESTFQSEEVPAAREKLLRDLEDVTTAIERLQTITPRLDGQRSTLRAPQLSKEQIQARTHRDKLREMEEIWRLIERTNGRRRTDGQRVDAEQVAERRKERRRQFLQDLVDNSEASRMDNQDAVMPMKVDGEMARARDANERDTLLDQLIGNAEDGRLGDQDATLKPPDQDKLRKQKQALVDKIIDFGESGRYHDQDSAPPTPRTVYSDANGNRSSELVTMRDFFNDPKYVPSMMDEQVAGNGDQLRRRANSLMSDTSQDDGKKSGTLRKIAGLVRRKSIGFSLRLSGPDLSSVNFVAEHQENLLAVQIMLHGVGLSLKDDLYIETAKAIQPGCGVNEALVLSRKDSSMLLRLALPTPVTVGQNVSFQQSDMHLEAKLSALPTQPSGSIASLNTALSHPLSAPELRKLRPKALCCAVCDREVADLSKALRGESRENGSGFKDLPSEHWAEMLEVWMCHDDPAFTAKLAQRTNEGFWPTQGNVLVGGSYLLVQQDGGKSANLQFQQSNGYRARSLFLQDLLVDTTVLDKPLLWISNLRLGSYQAETTFIATSGDDWAVLSCICGHELGKKRDGNAKYGAGTMKFSKWAVALLRDDDIEEAVEPIRFPLSVFILSDLLELAQAHATFRFVIQDEATHEPRLLLWLFNPSMRISYRHTALPAMPSPSRLSSGQANGHGRRSDRPSNSRRSSTISVNTKTISKSIKAAKVFYHILDEAPTSDFVPGWGNMSSGQVETVSYPKEVCDGLIETLNESNAVYPAGRREMNKLRIGFLERLSCGLKGPDKL